jgi:Ankyrin repeats (3 copies)
VSAVSLTVSNVVLSVYEYEYVRTWLVCMGGCAGEQTGKAPLHIAAMKGHLEVCKWLVESTGADANFATKVSMYM